MRNYPQFYVDGAWVDPVDPVTLDVIDPSTEEAFATIALGSAADVDRAVAAARQAFPAFSLTSREERLDLLERVLSAYEKRSADLALAISQEMGAPRRMALNNQVGSGAAHIRTMIETLKTYRFDRLKGSTLITKEAVGVVAMITPWNWPLNQITCKVAPALAAGCTMVLKPSEIAPVSAMIFAEVMHEAGVPAGIFNLVNGDGPTVGEALARHPDVDMVSITGSTRAGVLVAKAAADTVKRVHQELGGKSANIILDDADLKAAVRQGVLDCFDNSGQSCNAPTRMLVPADRMAEALEVARAVAAEPNVGPADRPGVDLGPVVSDVQFAKIQALIRAGIDEGATLVAGGVGRPEGLDRGHFVKPTVFGNVDPDMRIAREEIFGPVLCILGYASEEEAIRIANDTPYGLAAYVQSADLGRARRVARLLRVGNVHINYPDWDTGAPFGGFKQSGNGREYAEFGLDDFLEVKGVIGYGT
ncbi:aldehyde dehydrogenase family protein [Ensifer sesbaniae]|uniref:aldehyde dehydrogenase family protein n=1 Tax=Ensifer sesbaniae TaxID=1214071 RepID=UPI001569935E|nr:aldehyde dehydrogenase family protein [Ensifer sesbaniae]MCK3779279.1 aldehyde dehydrogenase family protein [Ensifer sesbaniae]NRQ12939.1 3-succinoylsemialdehyde-pyridine dehydrogenase [Ensifer sesbaniae]